MDIYTYGTVYFLDWQDMICYHGTNRIAAKSILREGFRPDCWFARRIRDAIAFGGRYVFSVQFIDAKVPSGWQFHHLDAIPVNRVIECRRD